MPTRIQIRRDTAAAWTAANPTLAVGEIGYETDFGGMKIGNGTTAWTSLPYGPNVASQSGAIITNSTFISPYGGGFTNIELLTTGTAASWSVPTALKAVGAKWKVTLVGSGGQGGGSGVATAGYVGGGGGSGGVVVGFFAYAAGQDTMTYTIGVGGTTGTSTTVGQTGTATTALYNGVTWTANGGIGGGIGVAAGVAGGNGGTAVGTGTSILLAGNIGNSGGVMAATSNYVGNGADAPLGLGFGGAMPATAAGAVGNAGTNYGAGGSGGRNGTGTTTRAGGAGTNGLIIIEY